jgi:hypothetical protein
MIKTVEHIAFSELLDYILIVYSLLTILLTFDFLTVTHSILITLIFYYESL